MLGNNLESPSGTKTLSRRTALIDVRADHFQKDVGDSYSRVCSKSKSIKPLTATPSAAPSLDCCLHCLHCYFSIGSAQSLFNIIQSFDTNTELGGEILLCKSKSLSYLYQFYGLRPLYKFIRFHSLSIPLTFQSLSMLRP